MIKNEWIKLFRNRVFLVCFAAMFVFYGFYLYWTLVLYHPPGLVERAPASDYNELAEELSSLTDEEKLALLTERRGQMEEMGSSMVGSFQFGMTELVYEEVWNEVYRAVHYQDICAAIISNAKKQESRLDRGNYGTLERRYLESWLGKTQAVYQRLTDIMPASCSARGIQTLVDNPVTDFCCLFMVLLAVFQILTVERQKEQIILSKTTVRGKRAHGIVKALVPGLLCILVTLLLLLEGILVVGSIYPFPSPKIPIQSIYSYCTLRINIGEFLCLYALLKILFYFLCTAMLYFVCCLLRKVIPIFLVILAGGGLLLSVYMGIPETSYLAPLRAVSPVALGQAGKLLERYQCVNIFGFAVNKLSFAVVMLCAWTLLFLTAAVKVYTVSEEKDILADRRSVFGKKRRWSVSLTAHECYKAFITQKLILLLSAAAVVSGIYLKTTIVNDGSTLADHFYYVYSYYLTGEYTDEIWESIRLNQEEVIANASRPDVQEGERVAYEAMLEALSRVSEYAAYLSEQENSYYINNPGYIALTGGDEGVKQKNVMTSMLMYAFAIVCFVLTMSVDYQCGENRLIHSTRKGRRHYVKAKVLIGMLISLVLLVLFWEPTLRQQLRMEGVDYIFAPAYSLMHLDWVWGGISIAAYIGLGYAARYLSLLVLMAFSYLVERKVKDSIVAIVCVCAVVEIPLAIMLLG
ncbi:MAG: hypothetical protein HDR21_07135 [Lachnospiraceae bacterium]|nr:hypothetical protein [Lachnospiraceae bacterium]MBD5481501.1 hypothetical protein [Lachnospiraceae bacterium]